MRSKSGFTIVEVSIVVAIIAILSTIAIFGYTKVQSNTRDSTRKGNVSVISEALETYYTKNGEYPSVRSLVNNYSDNTGSVVASKLGIKTADLLMPRIPSGTTNSLLSAASPTNDFIVYTGTSTINVANCQTVLTGGCDAFTLQYQEESGALITITGRHSTRSSDVGSAPGQVAKPSVGVALSGTNVVATATAATCENASLTAKFSFSYQTNTGGWSAYTTWGTANTFSTPGAQGSHYDFKAVTRCDNGPIAGVSSPESDVASYDYAITPPAAPITTVTLSGANVLATVTPVTCPAGTTAQYAIRGRTNGGSWPSYPAWSTTLTASQTANQGVKYGYQAQTKCILGSVSSTTTQGVESTYIHPISTPTMPAVTVSTSGSVTNWFWTGTSCPSGTTAEYQERDTMDGTSAYDSGWYGPYDSTFLSSPWNTSSQGYQFTEAFQTRCTNSNATSAWSATVQGSYLRAITAPGAPTNFVGSLSADRKTVNWSWTAPSCYGSLQNQDQKSASFNPPGNFGGFTAQGWWAPVWGQIVIDGSGNPTVIPAGAKFAIEAKYICVNTDTGRQSAFGPLGVSPTFTAP